MAILKQWYSEEMNIDLNKAKYPDGDKVNIGDLVSLEFGNNGRQVQQRFDFIGETPCKVIGYNDRYKICVKPLSKECVRQLLEIINRDYLILPCGYKKIV